MWIIVCSIVTRLLIKLYYFLDLLTASVFRFKSKNVFSRGFFLKIMALCMVSIQDRVMMARVRYLSKEGALSSNLLFSDLKNIWPSKRIIPSRCPDAFSTNYCWSDCTCTYTRCGRVTADNIAYAKFRKTLLI